MRNQPKPPFVLISIILVVSFSIMMVIAVKKNPFDPQNQPRPPQQWEW